MNEELRKEDETAGEGRPRKRTAPWLLGGLVLLLLFTLVALQAFGLWTVVPPDTTSDTLLLYALSSLNFAAFVVFSFIFIRSLLKLRRERRERQLGSKIKTRLVVYFISLSLLPITAMALFSYLFFNRTVEKWFYNFPENVIREATEVERKEAANQARSLRETASMLGAMIESEPGIIQEPKLQRLIESGNLLSIIVLTVDGQTLARSDARLQQSEQEKLQKALEIARLSNNSSEGVFDGQSFDVAVVTLSDSRKLLVAAARRDETSLGNLITGSQSEYNSLVTKQRKVRLLGLSTLGLMTLLLLFAATWIAIHLARGIAKPIRALAEASKEVARGNLSHRVSTIADDELALLADSFNQMTAQLEENRRKIEMSATELREKNLALEERRNYIETVLESLSTGVISLDEYNCVTTINAAATSILKLESTPRAKVAFSEIVSPEDHVILERLLRRARRAGHAAEQTELGRSASPDSESLPVALTVSALGSANGKGRGVVLVIEDLSELLSAQRAAAWSEVARRMAHEIKNPLTPIQLSAERIAKNFKRETNGGGRGNGSNGHGEEIDRVAQVVDECTTTITREVAGLKAMVDEFSRFARLPNARLEAADLNEVVLQAVALYEDRLADVRLDVRLGQSLPPVMLDGEQMRRVFVNLIDNSLEALANLEGERRITIATAHDPARALVLIEVTDTGHGIPRSDFNRLFQPNFSTRERGTGLGLAIVQRIITDHSGRIRAVPNYQRGAKFSIELPATNA